jgi:hypothetical protein
LGSGRCHSCDRIVRRKVIRADSQSGPQFAGRSNRYDDHLVELSAVRRGAPSPGALYALPAAEPEPHEWPVDSNFGTLALVSKILRRARGKHDTRSPSDCEPALVKLSCPNPRIAEMASVSVRADHVGPVLHLQGVMKRGYKHTKHEGKGRYFRARSRYKQQTQAAHHHRRRSGTSYAGR